MKSRSKILKVLLILTVFLASSFPASAEVGFGFDENSKVQIFGGTFRDVYLVGDNVTIFVLLWKMDEGGLGYKNVTINIYKYGRYDYWYHDHTNKKLVSNINTTTDENGFAKVVFIPAESGRYHVETCYKDICADDDYWTPDFAVLDESEGYYFIPKNFMVKPNSTVTLRYTLMEPFTRTPYTNPVNLTIPELGIEEHIMPINGTIEYVLNLTDFNLNEGDYTVNLDSKKAGFIWVTEKPRLFVLAQNEIQEGDEATVLAFLYDQIENKPVSGSLNLTLKYYYKNGSIEEKTEVITLQDGYYVLRISDTSNLDTICYDFHGYDQGWGSCIHVTPGNSEATGDAVFDIEPEKQLVSLGQSVTLIIRGYNTTDNTPPKGNHTLAIHWYTYNGQYEEYLGKNESMINFGDQNEVIRRITVPKDAYYGEVFIGNVRAEFYVMRSGLSLWGEDIDFEYNEDGTFTIANATEISGMLENITKEWHSEWEDYYQPIVNETVYIFYWNGTKVLKTDKNGRFSTEFPVYINDRIPLGFGLDGIGDTQNQWYLALHKSGAWDLQNAMVRRDIVRLEVSDQEVFLRKFKDSSQPSSKPVVVEIVKGDGDLVSLVPISMYWNTSEFSFSLEPSVYEIRILPNEWLSFAEHERGINWNLYSNRRFAVLPEEVSLFQDEYTTDRPGYLEIPIKLPEKGVFFVKYWIDGKQYLYFNETDDNGAGIVKIYVPAGEENEAYEYSVYYGFMTGSYVMLGLEDWFNVILTQDTDPPTINLNAEPQVQEVGKNVTIMYEVVDWGGIDSIKVEITNITDLIQSTVINVGGSSTYAGRLNFTIRDLEDYIVRVWANDTRGNSISKSVNFFGKLSKQETITLEENTTKEISVGGEIALAIKSAENTSVEMNISVASEIQEKEARFKMEGEGFEDLTYIKVDTNEPITYNWVILNVSYDESVLKKLGIPESAVKLFYWNGSEWIDLEEHIGETIYDNSPYGNITIYGFGRNTQQNYIWANVSHLSDYVLAIKLPDLTVIDTTPKTAYTNENTNVIVKIKNLGGYIDTSFKVALYIDGKFYGVKELFRIGEGEVKEVRFSWTPLINKTYTVKAVVDYTKDIHESNETNNEKTTIISAVNKGVSKQVSKEGGSITTINLFYYINYKRLSEKFDELYNKSMEIRISNETLQEAIKYKDLAEEHYKETQEYGPIMANIDNVKILAPLRKAYLNLKKAVEILENAVSSS